MDPTTPHAKRLLKEKQHLHKLKLTKQLERARAKMGIRSDQDLNQNSQNRRMSRTKDPLAQSKEIRQKILEERAAAEAEKQKQREEKVQQRTLSERKRQKDRRRLMSVNNKKQVRLGNHVGFLLEKIQKQMHS